MEPKAVTEVQRWYYTARPEGEVTQQHYTLKTEPLEDVKDGEVLIKSLYLSVDPYMRIQQSAKNTWESPYPLNSVQTGGVVGEVVISKYPGLQPGDIVNSGYGWQTYGIVQGSSVRKIDPNWGPISTAIGILGMPGRTAYFGLLDAGKAQPGETVVVSGAAGAVGSIVVQIAKIKGCRVVAIAGSDSKLKYLKEELGADVTLNYHHFTDIQTTKKALEEACPKGIDVYFDNTGGVVTDAVMFLINLRARIIICGQISQYNGKLDEPELAPRFLHHILYKRATIQGILARDYYSRMDEMIGAMVPWLKEGKLKNLETIVDGFESLPAALNSLFHGANQGKLVVKV